MQTTCDEESQKDRLCYSTDPAAACNAVDRIVCRFAVAVLTVFVASGVAADVAPRWWPVGIAAEDPPTRLLKPSSFSAVASSLASAK